MIKKDAIHGIQLVTIPAGNFIMGNDFEYRPGIPENVNKFYGDEQPVHKVTLSSFNMSSTQITQSQYIKVTGNNRSNFTGDGNLPVTNLSADEALKYCNMLSKEAGLDPVYDEMAGTCDFNGNGFRLPTEAEWEYACRAGTTTLFYTGNTERDLDRAGWYLSNSGGKTHPVGRKEPNAWGLYDMHGNVFEFCYDGYDMDFSYGPYTSESVTDPTGFPYFNMRVMRGGGWFSDPCDCRSALRSSFWTGGNDTFTGGNYYIGFRIVQGLK
jgi:formylglycine-generating enzyme required for sulfatase activity